MRTFIPAIIVLFLSSAAVAQKTPTDAELHAKAQKLAQKFIIVDTHIDVPYRLNEHWEDISKRTEKGDFDYPRAKEGGLNAPFMSIYVPSDRENNGAKRLADSLIDMVEKFAKDWPKQFAVARSVSDVTSQFKKGKISLCMGMENGSPIEHKLENIQYFHNRGIRYITLTHAKDNHISDSSYDTTHTWRGLSPFGREVVAEMNRVGIMVDISHVSDQAFYEVMNITKAPVIASHSSCRSFTPGFERNMSDDMIKLLAKNGGVIQIAFGSSFVSGDYFKHENEDRKIVMAYLKEHNLRFSDPKGREYAEQYHKDHPIPFPQASIVAEHIDHVAKLVGVDYVGIGSDFDGVGDSLPIGLKDVSQYPNLIYELLKKGYSESDIQKICGGNLLRVWAQVEHKAKEMQSGKS